jgi:hypothetical protein
MFSDFFFNRLSLSPSLSMLDEIIRDETNDANSRSPQYEIFKFVITHTKPKKYEASLIHSIHENCDALSRYLQNSPFHQYVMLKQYYKQWLQGLDGKLLASLLFKQ